MPSLLQWDQISGGFLDVHTRLNATTGKTLEASSFVYSLIELLSEKGLISLEELDARQAALLKRLEQQIEQRGEGVKLLDPELDKYTFSSTVDIDCPDRIPLCRAACCKLMFALSRQDVREGIVHWDLANPYLIAHAEDGYCEHMEPTNCSCSIREQRPVPCRAYDCRQEKHIWLDFENRVINPKILEPGWPYNLPEGQQLLVQENAGMAS